MDGRIALPFKIRLLLLLTLGGFLIHHLNELEVENSAHARRAVLRTGLGAAIRRSQVFFGAHSTRLASGRRRRRGVCLQLRWQDLIQKQTLRTKQEKGTNPKCKHRISPLEYTSDSSLNRHLDLVQGESSSSQTFFLLNGEDSVIFDDKKSFQIAIRNIDTLRHLCKVILAQVEYFGNKRSIANLFNHRIPLAFEFFFALLWKVIYVCKFRDKTL